MTTRNTAHKLDISYTLSFPEAQAHYVDVAMHISGITQPAIDLKMPVWTPGSYLVREYAKNVEQLTARTGNKTLPAKKTDKNTWHITTADCKSINVNYRLYCFEVSVRTSFVNIAHAFISPAGTFLYPANGLHLSSTITISPYKGWKKVSTGLDMVDNNPFKLYAPDYDTLYDSPIEVGTQDVFDFTEGGVQYEIAMCMGGNYDREKLKTDLANMVSKETAIFGENPNKRYVFIVHNYLKGGGGLEHLNSTVLGATRDAYTDEKAYQRFMGLAAHEHFHLWNVKRLRPAALGPFDYDNENYTNGLWVAEGFTNYYDNLVVHRMGLYPVENYLNLLADDINQIENQPGQKIQPLAEASFDAWIKHYRPNENSINSTISYYTKGGIIAMMLDLLIIKNSRGAQSLDDVMRYAYNQFYKNLNRGFTDDEFKLVLEKFTGGSLDDFYEKYIYGLYNVNYNKYLGYAGYQLVNELADDKKPSLGITINTAGGKTTVTGVLRGASGWVYGLNVNDQLLSINDEPFTDLNLVTEKNKVGQWVNIKLLRDGLPVTLKLKLFKGVQVKYRLAPIEKPTAQQLLIRKKWLSQ